MKKLLPQSPSAACAEPPSAVIVSLAEPLSAAYAEPPSAVIVSLAEPLSAVGSYLV